MHSYVSMYDNTPGHFIYFVVQLIFINLKKSTVEMLLTQGENIIHQMHKKWTFLLEKKLTFTIFPLLLPFLNSQSPLKLNVLSAAFKFP